MRKGIFLHVTFSILLIRAFALGQLPGWSPTNGPFGGQIYAVAVSPDGIFFAAARHTGARSRLYRSVDKGVSYQELTVGDSISFLGPIFCGRDGLVLCGAATPSGAGGIVRSTDDGTSWTTVPPLINVTSFARDSAGSILCGADAGNSFTSTAGVFLSTDNGASWKSLNGDLSVALVSAVAFGDGGALYICNEGYYGTDVGVFRSTDSGTHWFNILSSFTVPMTVITSTPSGTILVGTGGSGVMRSTNGGQNWTPVVKGGPSVAVKCFSVDSTGGVLEGSSTGLYRSTDDGATWTASSDGLADLEVMSVASGAGDVRLVGDLMSVSESTDGGKHWFEASRGIRSSLCSAIVSTPQGTLLVSTHAEGGVFRSTDGGNDWLPVSGNLAYRLIYALASARDGTLFACVQADSDGSAVFRSTDQGLTWQGLPTMMPKLPALGIATRGESEVVVVSNAGNASTGVFRSTDNGSTWNALTTGYTNLTFWSVVLPPDGRILAGYYGGVVVSSDTGRTWSALDYGLPYSIVNSLACGSSGRVFATTNGFGTYYLTSDIYGPGWAPADSGLPKADFGSIQRLAVDSAGALFGVSITDGVWWKQPGQLTWSRFASGLIDTNVTGICISPEGTAYATTYGEGVFSTSSKPSGYTIFNFAATRETASSVRISWSAMNDGDLLGFEVQRLRRDTSVFASVSASLIPVDPASGVNHQYFFADTTATSVSETYRLRLISRDGSEHFSDTVIADPFTSIGTLSEPLEFKLEQNYPNPFNPTTGIRYRVSGNREVRLSVYDVLGREVAVLVSGRLSAGIHEVRFDGSRLASGVYFYRLVAGEKVMVKKMTMIK